MLKRINSIKNIGRFYQFKPKNRLESCANFGKFSLIYAENGTGKSTITKIFKSLSANDPTKILAKKTIGSKGDCEVELKINNKEYKFSNGAWNKTPDTNFLIFDEEFIEKNVFSSTSVGTENKRELFNYVILGKDNVTNIEQVNELANITMPPLTQKIKQLEKDLKALAGIQDIKKLLEIKEMSKEDFESLNKLTESRALQIENSERIKTHSLPQKIEIEWLDYKELIAKNIDTISHTAEYRTHIQHHHQWIKQGIDSLSRDDKCPFCFQSIAENEVIAAYKQFFSEECQLLISEVKNISIKAKNSLNDDKVKLIENMLENNDTCLNFWHSMDDSIPSSPKLDNQFFNDLKIYRKALLEVFVKKQANILEELSLTKQENEHLSLEFALKDSINAYNLELDKANEKIQNIKEQQVNLDELKKENVAQKIKVKCLDIAFFNDETKKSLDLFLIKKKEKEEYDKKIKSLRQEINQSSEEILKKYLKNINELLDFFGVEYRVGTVKQRTDSRRNETLQFTLTLCGLDFEPNGGSEPYTLYNTLSSGDKSTLAFAFYLAKLVDEDLKETIIVFDDPITSLDFFRMRQTSIKILSLLGDVKQIIILTHSMEFCKQFSNISHTNNNNNNNCNDLSKLINEKFFKLSKSDSTGVNITSYNKQQDMFINIFQNDKKNLSTFLEDSCKVDKMDVIRSIRPYTEAILFIYKPDLKKLISKRKGSLGNLIRELKEQNLESKYIKSLEFINSSVSQESHGSADLARDDYANGMLDDTVRNLCKIALELEAKLGVSLPLYQPPFT